MLTAWRRQKKLVGGIVDLIAFHNDHVEHDTNGLDENEKKSRGSQKGLKAHPQRPRRMSPRRQVKNIVIEAQRTKKQIATWVTVTTYGASIRSLRQVLSCYKSASNNMSEGNKDGEDGEEGGETAAAKRLKR